MGDSVNAAKKRLLRGTRPSADLRSMFPFARLCASRSQVDVSEPKTKIQQRQMFPTSDSDAAWEARAIARDLTRSVLSRDAGAGTSRWRADFGSDMASAANAAAATAPLHDTAAARRRRLESSSAAAALPGGSRERRCATTSAASANTAAKAAPSAAARLAPDPCKAMEQRQARLRAAREERRQRELLDQAKALERHAANEAEARARRASTAASAEERRQQLEHATAEARQQLEREREAFEQELARKMALQEQERVHSRLTMQLERLQRQRAALRDGGGDGSRVRGDERMRQGSAATMASNARPHAWGGCTYDDDAERAEGEDARERLEAAGAAAAAVEAASSAEAAERRWRARRLRAAVFRAWQRLHIAAQRRQAQAAAHHAWRLRGACWSAWVRDFRAAQIDRAARSHEEGLRAARSAALVAEHAYRSRVLARCFRTWYTWRAVQARLRTVHSEHQSRQDRIQRLLASIDQPSAIPPFERPQLAPAVMTADRSETAAASPPPPGFSATLASPPRCSPAVPPRAVPPPALPPPAVQTARAEPPSPMRQSPMRAASSATLEPPAGPPTPPTPPTPPPPRAPFLRAAAAATPEGDPPTPSDAELSGRLAQRAAAGLIMRRTSPGPASWQTPSYLPTGGLPFGGLRHGAAAAVASPPPAARSSLASASAPRPPSASSASRQRAAAPSHVPCSEQAVVTTAVAVAVHAAVEAAVGPVLPDASAVAASAYASSAPADGSCGRFQGLHAKDEDESEEVEEEGVEVEEEGVEVGEEGAEVGVAAPSPQVVGGAEGNLTPPASAAATPAGDDDGGGDGDGGGSGGAHAPAAKQAAAGAQAPASATSSGGAARAASATTPHTDPLFERQRVRAEERRVRRLELQQRYEEGQRAAAAAAKAEQEAAAAAAAAERRDKMAALKAAREASERRRQQLAVVQAKARLAELHCDRRRLIDWGWRPWRAVVHFSRLRMARAASHREASLTRPVMAAWSARARRTRAFVACEAAVPLICAQRLCVRAEARRGLMGLVQGLRREDAGVRAARKRLYRGTLRRLWAGWAQLAERTRDLRRAEELRWEMAADVLCNVVRSRRAVRAWAQRAEEWRLESREKACKDELWRKVSRWIADEPLLPPFPLPPT